LSWDAYTSTLWDEPRPDPIAAVRKQAEDSFEDVFASEYYLRLRRQWDPNMYAEASPVPALREDVCRLYGFGAQDVSDDDAVYKGPESEGCLALWGFFVLPTVTVHIRTAKVVNVSLGVASCLLTPSVNCQELPWHTGVRSETNVCHLLRILIQEIRDRYAASDVGVALLGNGGNIKVDVIRHKKPIIDLETGLCRRGASAALSGAVVQATANSDRPGFVVEERATADGEWKEAVEFYVACGLPYQHDLQESLLARCHNVSVAVCVVSTIASLLHVFPTHSTINFGGNKAKVAEDAATAHVKHFTGLLEGIMNLESVDVSADVKDVAVPLGTSASEMNAYMSDVF
jgi:hypothetical protein